MPTPAEHIAYLDASLDRAGETITLRRRIGTGATFVEVTMRARLDGFRSQTLVGGVKQTFSDFIASPTQLNAAIAANTWPGAAGGGTALKIGDFLRSTGGVDRKIEAVQPVRIADTIVRWVGQVQG